MLYPKHCALLLVLALIACKDDPGPNQIPAPTFSVDPSLKPTAAPLPGPGNTKRPVAAVTDASGTIANFVEQELLLVTDSDAEVQAFVQRWKGQLLGTADANAQVDGKPPVVKITLPKIHQIKIDASLADRSKLGEELKSKDDKARGAHRVSSDLGLGTLAAAAHEAAQGQKVGVNFVMMGDTLADRTLTDAATGEGAYTPNAFDWPYMRTGGPLDIGVAEAWRALDQAGKLKAGSVGMAILDGGFVGAHADYPPDGQIISAVPFLPVAADIMNFMSCGGQPCPWHGTAVAVTAFGVPDNGFAAAGTAGYVARPSVLLVLGDMFTGVQAVLRAAATGARVINMSWGVPVPAALGFANGPFEGATMAVRGAGVLLFSSAGNAGGDIDAQDCFIACWESTWHTPCENEGVHCVGGTKLDVAARDPGSNYGSAEGGATVDIAGPYTVYGVRASPTAADPTGTDPTNPSPTRAFQVSGTSLSSPFVAGVAALIWAARPELSANEVESILFSTAHSMAGTGLKKRVNALAAVTKALGGTTPTPDAGARDLGVQKEAGSKDGPAVISCNVAGTWKGNMPGGPFAGQSLTWQLAQGGTWLGTIAIGTLNGTWKLTGSTLGVTDLSSTPTYLACPASQEGTYSVSFSGDCSKMTLSVVSEPCDGRKAYLNGFNPTRQ